MKKISRVLFFTCYYERFSILFWNIGIVLYNIFTVYSFTLFKNNESVMVVYKTLPRVWKNILGKFFIPVHTIEGWMITQFFAYIVLLIAIFLSLLSTSAISRELENHCLEIPLSQAVSRGVIILGKMGALVLNCGCMLVINLGITLSAFFLFRIPEYNLLTIVYCYMLLGGIILFLTGLVTLLATLNHAQKKGLGMSLGTIFCLFLLSAVLNMADAPLAVRVVNPFYHG
jgi:ABC-type transport system involved in multi-copper enzyme maturation permease subunit